jgi:hypothetical protein
MPSLPHTLGKKTKTTAMPFKKTQTSSVLFTIESNKKDSQNNILQKKNKQKRKHAFRDKKQKHQKALCRAII